LRVRSSISIAKFSSTSINLRLSDPIPEILTAFSMDECAWDEV
jgi:hypothetical protein